MKEEHFPWVLGRVQLSLGAERVQQLSLGVEGVQCQWQSLRWLT